MNYFIMIIAKIAKLILSKLGRGTAFPGDLAFKLNNNILSYFELPKTTILVTGTTGKTSVSETLYEIYKNAGYKTVTNLKGSNLIGGVISSFIEASKLNGKTKVDALIIECDERYIKIFCKYITPKYFIITNLSRDQLARNGHPELVFNEINNSIKKETHLILNADDPLVTKFSLGKENDITYFGVKKNNLSVDKNDINTLDLAYCPICHKKLQFDYFNYGNLGNYKCPNNDYSRPVCNYEATSYEDKIVIDNNEIKINNTALYNVYNLTACYAVAAIDDINVNSVINTLNTLSLKVKRLNQFSLEGVNGTILLSKNETPLSYNQSLEYIKTKKGKKTVAIGFTNISGRYNLKDLSWLYDINFELLNDESIDKIILIGPFSYDLAVRLKIAKVDMKKIDYCIDYRNSLDYIIKNAEGDLYCVVYFDLNYKYIDELKDKGVKL